MSMTIGEAYRNACRELAEKGIPDPKEDACLMLTHITGLSSMEIRLTKAEQPLSIEQEQLLASLLLSRARRIPLQYLLGEQWFYGRRFQVDSRVLVPRQETETLCELGVAFLKERKAEHPSALDLCTGSGAIAVTLQCECPTVSVTASDLSSGALELAGENAALYDSPIRFVLGDLWEPLSGQRFDLILSNPPYIPTEECKSLQEEVRQEPRMALDGGCDGLDFYRRIASDGWKHLRSGGMLAMEVGDGQAEAVASLLRIEKHYREIQIHHDLYGKERIVSARSSEP